MIRSPATVALAALLAGACDRAPTGSQHPQAPAPVLAMLQCTADVRAQSLSCFPASLPDSARLSIVTLGHQHRDVRMLNQNTAYASGEDVFSSEVWVQNLLHTSLGTPDGSTPSASGIRVFFHGAPTNGVEVDNPTGIGTFTAADQPYYEWDDLAGDEVTTPELGGDGRLAPGERSKHKLWRFRMNGATRFSFFVAVQSEVDSAATPMTRFVQIDGGSQHTCALSDGGTPFCWGYNGSGEIGQPGGVRRWVATPVSVPSGMVFTAVTAGNAFSCAVSAGGQAYCWGNGTRLGDSSSISTQPIPVEVAQPSGVAFIDVQAGFAHGCAVTGQGQAYCWGNNGAGELGDSTTTTPRDYPVAVRQPDGVVFDTIAVGRHATCGLDPAGQAYCWGQNTGGQLGDSTKVNRTFPVPVRQPVGVRFTAISSGGAQTCALTSSGQAYCWGDNSGGSLGNGTQLGSVVPVPVSQNGLSFSFIAASAGGDHVCAITTGGEAYCWGYNGNGRLGDGTIIRRLVPTRVAVPAGTTMTWIGLGGGFTCAVRSDGPAMCWGGNIEGQLGTGNLANHHTPEFVAGSR